MGGQSISDLSVRVACCVRLLLTCAFLMTSSHSKAGVRKDADEDDYPIVDNLVEDSFAHSYMDHGLAIGNSIISVNGKSCKGMVGSDVHALVKAIEPGAGVRIKLQPAAARIKHSKRRSNVPSQSMRGASSMTSLGGAAPGPLKRPSMDLAGSFNCARV